MEDFSAMKSYMEKHNLYYFIFSPNSETYIKAIIRHLPPDRPAEVISNILEELVFNVFNLRQMMANRRAHHRQAYVETLPLFLVT
jgi:hypothetical protein